MAIKSHIKFTARKTKLFSLFALCLICLSFQTNEPPITITLPDQQCRIKTDDLNNTYVIHKDEILKYNAAGVFLKRYSNKRLGNITMMDCMNPLKILVYYKDFQQVVFLDDQLTQNSEIVSLEELGYEQADLICASYNNSFWIYSKQNNELVRFNSQLQPIVKTGNLKPVLQRNLDPNLIKESNGYLYMNCPDEGVLLFDIYGTFYKIYPIKGLTDFNVMNETIVYFQNHKLQQYQPTTFNTAEKEVQDSLIKHVIWQKDQYYLVYPDSVVIKHQL